MSVAASRGCHIGPNYITAVIFNIPDHSGMSISSSVTSGWPSRGSGNANCSIHKASTIKEARRRHKSTAASSKRLTAAALYPRWSEGHSAQSPRGPVHTIYRREYRWYGVKSEYLEGRQSRSFSWDCGSASISIPEVQKWQISTGIQPSQPRQSDLPDLTSIFM